MATPVTVETALASSVPGGEAWAEELVDCTPHTGGVSQPPHKHTAVKNMMNSFMQEDLIVV